MLKRCAANARGRPVAFTRHAMLERLIGDAAGAFRRRSRPSALSETARIGEKGIAAIEFAFVAPLFLMLLFGTVEFGRLLWTREALREAALAGARCMAIAQGTVPNGSCVSGGSYSSSATRSYIQAIAGQWAVTLATAEITLTKNASCGGSAGSSGVSISSGFSSAAAKLIKLSGSVALSASACYPNSS